MHENERVRHQSDKVVLYFHPEYNMPSCTTEGSDA
jgi:peroxiredoxin